MPISCPMLCASSLHVIILCIFLRKEIDLEHTDSAIDETSIIDAYILDRWRQIKRSESIYMLVLCSLYHTVNRQARFWSSGVVMCGKYFSSGKLIYNIAASNKTWNRWILNFSTYVQNNLQTILHADSSDTIWTMTVLGAAELQNMYQIAIAPSIIPVFSNKLCLNF